MHKHIINVDFDKGTQIDRATWNPTLFYKDGYYTPELKQTTLEDWLDYLPTTNFTPKDKPFAPKLFPQQDKDGYSGIVCLDFDSPNNIDKLLKRLRICQFIFAGGTSISEKGVWAFTKVTITNNPTLDKAIYNGVKKLIENNFGESVDEMISSCKFGRTASFNKDTFFTKDTFIEIKATVRHETRFEPKRFTNLAGKNIKASEAYCQKVFERNKNVEQGSRNSTLNRIAWGLNQKAIAGEIVRDVAVQMLFNLGAHLGLQDAEISRTLLSAGILTDNNS